MALKAMLHIETVLQNGKTTLKKSFCATPFKIADITEDRNEKALKLMMMCSSPGVLDGDEYNFQVDVAEDCCVKMETQSFQRIFQMTTGASQRMTVSMSTGSSFTYLPHPLVPHRSSIFDSRNKIYMDESCSLIWGEVMSCGRGLNKEVFEFSSYHSVTEIFIQDELVVKENLLVKPKEMKLNGISYYEGYTHQATLLYLHESACNEELKKKLICEMELEQNISFGISSLAVSGVVVRVLGHKAEQLFLLLRRLSLLIESSTDVTVKPFAYV